MPKLTGIVETSLYVDNVDRAEQFYTALFDAPVLHRDERLSALEVAEGQMLLLFLRGASVQPNDLGFGTIPAHDGSGALHVCFGIAANELAAWEEKLRQRGIAVESRICWPRGAISLYFRDPDGHAVELATSGLWK